MAATTNSWPGADQHNDQIGKKGDCKKRKKAFKQKDQSDKTGCASAEEEGERPSHEFFLCTPEDKDLQNNRPKQTQDSEGRDKGFGQQIKQHTQKSHGISFHSSSFRLSARFFSVEGFSWLRYTICS